MSTRWVAPIKRGFIFCALAVILLAAWPSSAAAQQRGPETITVTSFEVKTLDDQPVGEQLMAGAAYKISFTVEVGPGIKEKGVLKTELSRSPGVDRYWTVKDCAAYPGIDCNNWQPGLPEVIFDAATQGKMDLVLEGAVPQDFVLSTLSNGEVLHFPREMTLLSLSFASGGPPLDEKKLEVIDKSIEDYAAVLAAREKQVTETEMEPRYEELVKNVIQAAKVQADGGHTDRAREILDAIPTADPPSAPPSDLPLWVGIVLLAGLALLLAGAFVMQRSRAGFLRSRVEDEAGQLALISPQIGRFDPNIAKRIDTVKANLYEAIGRRSDG